MSTARQREPAGAGRVARLTPGRWLRVIGGLLVLSLVGAAAATLVGWANPFRPGLSPDMTRTLLLDLRLPRVALAGAVGAALAVSGALFQALIRNPLASPYILGIAGGGALGAVLAMTLGLRAALLGVSSITAFAFLGSLGALALVTGIARRGSLLPRHTLLLTGVVVNALFSAGILFLHSLAGRDSSQRIVYWLMGFIPWERSTVSLATGIAVVAVSAAAFPFARHLNLMSLGEEQAAALGVDLRRARSILLVAASLLTATAVAVCGPIGFVGLVVPHIVRLAFGADHRLLLPAAFLCGGLFLITADAAARCALPRTEMPVGVVTALVGGPFFLWLLRENVRKAILE